MLSSNLFAQDSLNNYFEDKTLRFDFYHSGNDSAEIIIFDELIIEPIWGGRKLNLIDTLNLGSYQFSIKDLESKKLLYSQGFSTLFAEWRTTDEARIRDRIYEGSVIFPLPKNKILLEIYSRNSENVFQNLYSTEIDPNNYFVTQKTDNFFDIDTIHYSGPSADKYDIVFLPEAYTENNLSEFIIHCKELSEYLFEIEPFDKMKDKINIWAVKAPSVDSLCDIPAEGDWYNTILDATYYTFNTERYIMTSKFQKVRDIAANAPYDQIYILANSDKYGGGAIYNHYSLTVTKNPNYKDIFIHELGHGIAGLADEYGYDTTYNDYYQPDVEPWERNITTLVNFESKWKHLVGDDIPIPTPSETKYYEKLGVFEGGGYVGKGVFRSTYDSVMRSLKSKSFNTVCKNALEEVILLYSN